MRVGKRNIRTPNHFNFLKSEEGQIVAKKQKLFADAFDKIIASFLGQNEVFFSFLDLFLFFFVSCSSCSCFFSQV